MELSCILRPISSAFHKCNSVCVPEICNLSLSHPTSGTESIDRLSLFSKSHMLLINPGNVVPRLVVKFGFLSVKTSILELKKKVDLEVRLFLDLFKKMRI